MLVLSGSSGRIERDRAQLLARAGATALTHQWFSGPGQPMAINEYPLERFGWGVGVLAAQCDRVILMGSSKTAEGFLLYAVDDPRVDAVVALSPSHVAWANLGAGADGALRPCRSSWTRGGVSVPFVPYDDDIEVHGEPPVFAPMYRQSLVTFHDQVEAARIPVERFVGEVLLMAGGDDQLWPSLDFAGEIERRRAAYGLATTVVTHPAAGHRVTFPGEALVHGGASMARGGTPSASRSLGRLAWPHVRRLLDAA